MAKSVDIPTATPPKKGPEEEVRQNVIVELKQLGWKDSRLQWRPECQVPATPHDLTKRERGQKFESCSRADIVAFADDSVEPHAPQIISEFKEPNAVADLQDTRLNSRNYYQTW